MPNQTNLRVAADDDVRHPYLTPTPIGFDTVWGFLLREEPHVLDLMLDPVFALIEDQETAINLCLRRGTNYVTVEAPAIVKEMTGAVTVPAFPMFILSELFPTNP